MAQIISKAPGRICLFGDHQDYLGLPVIACAIDRHVWVRGIPNTARVFQISLPDLDEEECILLQENTDEIKKGDHLRASLKVLERYGCIPITGYDVIIQGDIPVNAGLSSSSAMVVAWVQWLLITFGCEHEITPAFIGQVAYEAEVLEQNSPGGKMDQFTSAIGGIIYLETDSNAKVMKLGTRLDNFIIAESGIPKNTVGLLEAVKTKAQQALSIIKMNNPGFNIYEAKSKDYEKFKGLLPEPLRRYFYAAIGNHLITQHALAEFQQKIPDILKLGKLMNAHHEILKDVLQITVPKIDSMVSAALSSGAYGVKIVGSGGGGSIVALADTNSSETIIQALKRAGAKEAYTVEISKGAHYTHD